jgi:hypothetical protein
MSRKPLSFNIPIVIPIVALVLVGAHVLAGAFVFGQSGEFSGGVCVPNQNCTNCLLGYIFDNTVCPGKTYGCALLGGGTTVQNTFTTCVVGRTNQGCTNKSTTKQMCTGVYYNVCSDPCPNQQGTCFEGPGSCNCPGANSHDGQCTFSAGGGCVGF